MTLVSTRIAAVFDYIEKNVENPIMLKDLAEIAHFSPFHFHRIFKSLTRQTVNDFVIRKKIEKAALKLLHSNQSVAEILFDLGFSDQSVFTRTFKKYFIISPTAFRKKYKLQIGRLPIKDSKIGQMFTNNENYFSELKLITKKITQMAQIEIRNLDNMELAAINCIGTQHLPSAFQQLTSWVRKRKLLSKDNKMLIVYHDSLKITNEDQAHLQACFLLKEKINPDGLIASITLRGGKHIVGRFEIEIHELEKCWTGLFIWMNQHGFEKKEAFPFELYHNDFRKHPEKKAIVDLCIPIM